MRLPIMLYSFVVIYFFMGLAQATEKSSHHWVYESETGFEGQAHIKNDEGFRMEVECGNGGGPSILLRGPKDHFPLRGSKKLIALSFDIDGKLLHEEYECHGSCGSFGFPSRALISALRRGSHLEIRHGQKYIAAFTLDGSNSAIAKLAFCLQADSY